MTKVATTKLMPKSLVLIDPPEIHLLAKLAEMGMERERKRQYASTRTISLYSYPLSFLTFERAACSASASDNDLVRVARSNESCSAFSASKS